MHFTRTIPGLAPRHISFDLDFSEDGYWRLRTWAGDLPGLRTKHTWTVYDRLTLSEAVDVIEASVSAYIQPSP